MIGKKGFEGVCHKDHGDGSCKKNQDLRGRSFVTSRHRAKRADPEGQDKRIDKIHQKSLESKGAKGWGGRRGRRKRRRRLGFKIREGGLPQEERQTKAEEEEAADPQG